MKRGEGAGTWKWVMFLSVHILMNTKISFNWRKIIVTLTSCDKTRELPKRGELYMSSKRRVMSLYVQENRIIIDWLNMIKIYQSQKDDINDWFLSWLSLLYRPRLIDINRYDFLNSFLLKQWNQATSEVFFDHVSQSFGYNKSSLRCHDNITY